MKNQSTSNNSQDYLDLFSLKDKTAIVTGGVGYLGSAISKGLAAYGANVILIGRTKETLKIFVDKNNPAFNNRFEYFVLDVTKDKLFRDAAKNIAKEKGSIDILVNNAFNEQREKPENINRDNWDQAMANILTHTFFCSQAVLPHMLKQREGSIINIASIYGILGIDQRLYQEVPSASVFYSTAKAGIIGMTKRLATEYASKGIRVNAVSPGHFPKPPKQGQTPKPNYVKGLVERTPMQRIGYPDELAGAAVFLASDASSFVTGHNLVVDGGFSTW